MAYSDRESSRHVGTTQRCQLATLYLPEISVTSTAQTIWMLDSAEIGAVNACLTVFVPGSTTVVVTCFVSNDADAIPSNAGRVTLANVFDETDTTRSLPFNVTSGLTKHFVLSYKEQPIITTFRYWSWQLSSASTTIAHAWGNAK
jgi:hypothetical protein